MTAGLPATTGSATGLRDLLGEIGDCKRIHCAGRLGSIAERGFASCWAALVAGADADRVMRWAVATALAAARLGDLDFQMLRDLGLEADAALFVVRRAFDDVADRIDQRLATGLRNALEDEPPLATPPPFVTALAAQPRAGATCPGKPRLMLEPAENHAEHCWAVAIFGVLLAPRYGADPVTVFLAGLSHHLHNATMPDSGFTGEMLLGSHLPEIYDRATSRALDELPGPLRRTIVSTRTILSDAATPEGRAFHAADVIDRVMQLQQHLRAASITMSMLLDEWQLVHAGPVKAFHDDVLAEMGLV